MSSSYKVSLLTGEPNFDSLPVAKITDYPLAQRDYRPYAQCIFCVGPQHLHLRMWAFEVSPPDTSGMRCVLYPFPQTPDLALYLDTRWDKGEVLHRAGLLLEGNEHPGSHKLGASLSVTPHNGEDLQGVYWGCHLSLPLSALEEAGGVTCLLQPGETLPGNFYKLCQDPDFSHQGSHFPADFSRNPYQRGSMGAFEVVSY